jgi:anti-sigma factor RsiW
MARCADIKLLLGPFEDGELEPHEMQEVARHVVGCSECEAELADYRSLAVSLRGMVVTPDLAGFSASILARIEELPVPFGTRLRRYLTSFGDGIGATLATGFAAAAVAVVTAVTLTSYLKQAPYFVASHGPARIGQDVASKSSTAHASAVQEVANVNSQGLPNDIANELAGDSTPVLEPVDVSGNSGAIISRLEADSPSVAVWSEPQTDTTVIWVPDQPR